MVMRTYTTGLSLRHFPMKERGVVKKRLAAIVQQLSDENFKHCQKYANEVVNHLIDLDIDNHCIMDPLPELNGGRGKYGVNELMKRIGVASNHLHSGYHQLLTSSKGYIDRVNKLREIFEFMNTNPAEFASWILWQRSTYANKLFARKWNVSFWYVDNLMRGVHKKYFDNSIIPCFLRDISKTEFIDAIDLVLNEFGDELTDRQKAFVIKLKKLKTMDLELFFIPTGWKYLKEWISNQGHHRSWMSVLRAVLVQVYLLDYRGMINKILTAKVTELLKIPFQQNIKNTKKQNISYQMVSGPKYVVRRENNKKSLELMRTRGYFELSFKFLEDRWKDAIVVRVYPSRKMRRLLNKFDNKIENSIDNNIKLRSMVVLPPKSNVVDIQLIFDGDIDDFVATDHLKHKISVDKTKVMGIDLNRRGEYAVVSNLDVSMPQEILEQSRRWDVVLENIAHLQYLQDKTNNSWKQKIYEFQMDALYRRKKNLRKDYHIRLANLVGQQMVSSNTETLVIEDLDVRTYGTRGALAKAVEGMADDTSLYAREVLAVRKFTGRDVELKKVSAYNSSRIHVDCGGILRRDISKNQYDIAPCNRCNKMVNTHKNAAIYLVRSTKP